MQKQRLREDLGISKPMKSDATNFCLSLKLIPDQVLQEQNFLWALTKYFVKVVSFVKRILAYILASNKRILFTDEVAAK